MTKSPSRYSGENVLKTFLTVTLLLTLTTATIICFLFVELELNSPLDRFSGTVVTISKGENARALASKLKKAGIIKHPAILLAYLRLSGKDKRLKPASIAVEPNNTVLDLVEKIINYREKPIKVVIYEGMDSFEIAEALDKLGIAKQSELLKLVFDTEGKPLEGYLFPDTYYFIPDTPAEKIIESMVSNFYRKALPVLKKSHILSPYETLIVASLIQKETYLPQEMPLIASVIYNRLKRRMPLQIDPTVIYAYKVKEHKNLFFIPKPKHLKIESPYNTYRVVGLPPTPICNPGLDAIRAAVYPAKTDYLYFVSKRDGSHYFSKTLREHINAIRRFLKKR